MLSLGRLRSMTAGRLSRREMLRIGSLAPVGVTLADLLRAQARAEAPRPRARSVILLWLWGGPSHLDTFDPKPAAPVEYRGPYSPIATSVPGVSITELLPKLAARADRYSIIRSLHHESNDHGIAGTIGLTGSDSGAISLGGQLLPGTVRPTHGSIVARVLGHTPVVPRFATVGGNLHQGKKSIRGEDAGPLPPMYDPFRLDYDPRTGVKLPDLEPIEGLTADGFTSRRKLLNSLDSIARWADASAEIAQLGGFYEQAFNLLTSSDARRLFDLSLEDDAVRTRYGRFRFGQCCLLARRLVEADVRFVQVNWSSHVEPVEDTGDGGWDMHDRNFQQLQDRHAWMLDQAASALLDDLAERGLLDETIVVAAGEFGRTPKINGKAGRDHWNRCYSALVAGGGIRSGVVLGASDALGETPNLRPVTPADLFRTVLAQIGITTTDLTTASLTPAGEIIEDLV